MRRMKRVLRDERGSSLPEALVTVIVSLIALAGMALAIDSFVSTERALNAGGQQNTQLSITDSTFRSDAEWATFASSTSYLNVTFVQPTASGGCKSDLWSLSPSADPTQPSPLTVTTTITSAMGSGSSSCAGSTTSTVTRTMLADASNTANFGFTNLGGRVMSFSGSTVTLATQTQPSGVDSTAWASQSIGKAVLNATLNSTNTVTTPVRISQVLLQVPRPGQAPPGQPASS